MLFFNKTQVWIHHLSLIKIIQESMDKSRSLVKSRLCASLWASPWSTFWGHERWTYQSLLDTSVKKICLLFDIKEIYKIDDKGRNIYSNIQKRVWVKVWMTSLGKHFVLTVDHTRTELRKASGTVPLSSCVLWPVTLVTFFNRSLTLFSWSLDLPQSLGCNFPIEFPIPSAINYS